MNIARHVRDTAGSFGPLNEPLDRADSFMRELEDELRLLRLVMAQNIGQTGRAVTSRTEVNRT